MNLSTRPWQKFSVGLTGGIGSGKSTVAGLLVERGAALIDTDAIAHQLSAPGGLAIDALRATFGETYIAADGAMDRARMRALVFEDPLARKRLEAILHPLIQSETARQAAQAKGIYLLFDVPLLVESGHWKSRCDRVLVVDCDERLQVERVMRRNLLAEPQIRAIIAAQATRQQRLAAADDVIENNLDSAALIGPVEALHTLYCNLASRQNMYSRA